MDNAERLVSKAHEWIDQASHELCWDEAYTTSRKGERTRNTHACVLRTMAQNATAIHKQSMFADLLYCFAHVDGSKYIFIYIMYKIPLRSGF